MLEPGSRLATYEVIERLAIGGMGEVYLCRHRLLDRVDAVKVLRPHLAGDDAFRRRFLREALSAAALRHPNIVTVYTADEVDGQLYLAMEFIRGQDLHAVLQQVGRLSLERTVRLMAQVADALDTAHRQGMSHRDVKPANVLVQDQGFPAENAFLVDFGLSKAQHAADQNITQSGQVLGSMAYIAPEQLAEADVDGRCDQYSLACMVFELLTGSVPFPRENQLATLTAHLTAPPPPVTGARPDLPHAVDGVVARAMAKNPADRWPSCGAFIAALAGAGAAPPAAPPAAPRAAPPAAPQPTAPPSPAGPQAATIYPRTKVMQPMPGPPAANPVSPPPAVPPGPAPAVSPQLPPAQPATLQPATAARLLLTVIGGRSAGLVIPIGEGTTLVGSGGRANAVIDDPSMAAEQLAVHVHGWSVSVTETTNHGGATVNGAPLAGSRALQPGDLLGIGRSLLEIRGMERPAGANPDGTPTDPVTLAKAVQLADPGLRRGPQHPQALVVRIGWWVGQPPRPLAVPLGGPSAVALRGAPADRAAVLRWMVLQAAALHDARDLCVAAAIEHGAGERWGWLHSLPHSRPNTAPLSGPHLATTGEAAGDLGRRLTTLATTRHQAASGNPAHLAVVTLPRVLAVLDDRLPVADRDRLTLWGPRLGIHCLRLLGPGEPLPHGVAVAVDVDGSGSLILRHSGTGPTGLTGVADGVSGDYARELADLLAE